MQELQCFRGFQNTVVGGELIKSSGQGALRAGTVVATDIDDQRVVELAHVLDRLDDAANLRVGISCVAGKDLRLAREEFLVGQGKRLPLRQLRWQRGKLGAFRDYAQFFLVGENH